MNKNTCFVTVIFPGNLNYFQDFLASLAAQTYKDFDLIVFNDQVKNLEEYLSPSSLSIKIIEASGSISEVRNQLFSYLKTAPYTYCIFGDSDDYFPENRIEKNLELLQDFEVVSNDLHLVSQDKKLLSSFYFSQKLENRTLIGYEDIRSKNICGLGNTAIRLESLPDALFFGDEIAAIDWVLFSRILLSGKKAVFSNETYIYYRQHEANSIGLKDLSEARLLKGIRIKHLHYQSLHKDYGILEEELAEIIRLKDYVSNKENLADYYHKILSLNINAPQWWEEIKTLNEI